MSETELIARLAGILGDPAAGVPVGIGDDAAVLAPDLVVTVDALVEDVHFRRATCSLRDIGWKALAVSVSDLAAMGATPLGAVVALVLGAAIGEDEAAAIYGGLAACARAFGCPVVGGDVSRGRDLALSVTTLGRASRPVLRSGARPGDVVAVTGSLGGSEAGRLLLEGLAVAGIDVEPLHERHRRPRPRLAEGLAIGAYATAMLDVSDGVATDARRIAAASGVTLEIDLDTLPLQAGVVEVAAARGMAPGAFAAAGGEDYELLVTFPATAGPRPGVALTIIGHVAAGPAAVRFTGAGASDALAGWDHLARG